MNSKRFLKNNGDNSFETENPFGLLGENCEYENQNINDDSSSNKPLPKTKKIPPSLVYSSVKDTTKTLDKIKDKMSGDIKIKYKDIKFLFLLEIMRITLWKNKLKIRKLVITPTPSLRIGSSKWF